VREGIGEGVGNWFEENIRRVVGDGRDTFFWYDTWVGDVPLRLKYPRLFDLAMNKECKVADMGRLGWTVDGRAWEWRRRLFAWEEECVRECSVLLNNFVLQDNVDDKWRWLLDPVNGYSVKVFYRYITSTCHISDRSLVDDVWHKHIPSKVSVLVWRLLRNRLPTKDNLVHRGVLLSTNAACVGGCGDSESATHLFLHCNIFGSLWSLVTNWLGISYVSSAELRSHFIQFTKMAGMPRVSHLYFRIIWFATIWVIWKERNNRIFQNTVTAPLVLIDKIKLHSFLWLKSKQVDFAYSYLDWWKNPLLCMGVLR
jgi:hypothetical protein